MTHRRRGRGTALVAVIFVLLCDHVAATVSPVSVAVATAERAFVDATNPEVEAAHAGGDAGSTAQAIAGRHLVIPVAGVSARELADTYSHRRGDKSHDAIDIAAPRGTPVIATDDGRIARLFTSVPGGLTIYQFDPDQRVAYYYAHLDRYAEGLREGALVRRGDVVGYVGSTGNAPHDAPHLHFAIFVLGTERQWWKGTPLNPYPLLVGNAR